MGKPLIDARRESLLDKLIGAFGLFAFAYQATPDKELLGSVMAGKVFSTAILVGGVTFIVRGIIARYRVEP